MNIYDKLNEAWLHCSNAPYRQTIKDAHQALIKAIKNFEQEYTGEALTVLNGAWANAHRILKDVPPEAGPNPNGAAGSVREPMRMAA